METSRRFVAAGVLALAQAGCGNPVDPDELGSEELSLEVEQKVVAPMQHVFNRGDEYSLTLTVRLSNRSNRPINMEHCISLPDVPLFSVELTSGAGPSAYADRRPSCPIGGSVIVVPAFDSRTDVLNPRTDTYLVSPFNPEFKTYPQPPGAVAGQMRISYSVNACSEEGKCRPVTVRSGPFQVVPPSH